jgi:hypothetical protein
MIRIVGAVQLLKFFCFVVAAVAAAAAAAAGKRVLLWTG